MPAIIDETALTAELASPISVPVGGDAHTAASLLPAWFGYIKRLKLLETFYTAAKALTLGGTLAPTDPLTIDLAGATGVGVSALTFSGAEATFAPGARLRMQGNLTGALFTTATQGSANAKTVAITSGAGAIVINTDIFDTVIVSGISGLRTLQFSDPTVATDGQHLYIVNESTGQFVAFEGVTQGAFGNALKSSAGNFRSAHLVFKGGIWHALNYGPNDP